MPPSHAESQRTLCGENKKMLARPCARNALRCGTITSPVSGGNAHGATALILGKVTSPREFAGSGFPDHASAEPGAATARRVRDRAGSRAVVGLAPGHDLDEVQPLLLAARGRADVGRVQGQRGALAAHVVERHEVAARGPALPVAEQLLAV